MQIFQKQKTVSIEQEDIYWKITVYFRDYFHEMKSIITINIQTKEIMAAEAQMTESPWDLCYEILAKMEQLVGLTIQKGVKDQVRKTLGGPYGCVHLVEMALDTITSVVQLADFHLMPQETPYKDRMKKMLEINTGICHTYSSQEKSPKLLKENIQSEIS